MHWYRNIFSHVPSTKVREIAAMLKAIHAIEGIVASREKAVRVIDKLRGLRLAKAAELAGGSGRRDGGCLPGRPDAAGTENWISKSYSR